MTICQSSIEELRHLSLIEAREVYVALDDIARPARSNGSSSKHSPAGISAISSAARVLLLQHQKIYDGHACRNPINREKCTCFANLAVFLLCFRPMMGSFKSLTIRCACVRFCFLRIAVAPHPVSACVRPPFAFRASPLALPFSSSSSWGASSFHPHARRAFSISCRGCRARQNPPTRPCLMN